MLRLSPFTVIDRRRTRRGQPAKVSAAKTIEIIPDCWYRNDRVMLVRSSPRSAENGSVTGRRRVYFCAAVGGWIGKSVYCRTRAGRVGRRRFGPQQVPGSYRCCKGQIMSNRSANGVVVATIGLILTLLFLVGGAGIYYVAERQKMALAVATERARPGRSSSQDAGGRSPQGSGARGRLAHSFTGP